MQNSRTTLFMKAMKCRVQFFSTVYLCILIVLFNHAKADEFSILFENLSIGESLDDIVGFLERENFEYETMYNDYGDLYVFVHSDMFGNKTEKFSTSLLFNKDENVKRVFLGFNSSHNDNLSKAYSDVSILLGKPDIISLPNYTDFDISESEITYFLQFYIVWIKENGIYLLENNISFNTYAEYSIWDGFNFDIDEDNSQDLSLTLFDHSDIDYIMNLIE